MERVNYEKPELKFEKVITDEAVANTCWGWHGSDTDLYYDTKGTGWVSFRIKDGPCALNLTKVTYYENKKDPGTALAENDPKYIETYNAVLNSGGAQGNPYAGEGKIVFPDDPDPKWS